MNLVRLGRVVRTLRRRRDWRQTDLADAAGVSQQAVSLVECGRAASLSLRTIERILHQIEAEVDVVARWRGGQLERLLDEGHAHLLGLLAERLEAAGWLVRAEVTYSRWGERGSIDLLAFQANRSALLVSEIKTEITSAEATLRKHDEKARLSAGVAGERFGWTAHTVSRMLVLPDATTPRRHVARQRRLFDVAYPLRGPALRGWLRDPVTAASGLLFLPVTKPVGGRHDLTGRRRVRRFRTSRPEHGSSDERHRPGPLSPELGT